MNKFHNFFSQDLFPETPKEKQPQNKTTIYLNDFYDL